MRLKTMFFMLLAAGLIAFAVFSSAQSARKTDTAKKGAADDFWTTDWDKAMADARTQKKPVIVDFYTDWCVWCKRLDKETYAAPEIMKRFKSGWIGLKVNPEDTSKKGTVDGKVMSYADIAHKYNVAGYPTIIFFDKEAKPVKLEFTVNFVPKEPFGPLLDYLKNELYKKNILIETYMREQMKK